MGNDLNRINRNIAKIIFLLLFFSAFGNEMNSQSLEITKIDVSAYPKVKAEFKVMNALMEELRYPAYARVTVNERGRIKTDSIYCPPKEETKFSIILTIDISRSMKEIVEGTGKRKIDLVKEAADNIVTAMPDDLTRWECAITSFDDICEINQRFTNDRDLLRSAIYHDSLFPRGGTDYNSGFLYDSRTPPREGALLLAREAKYKPVLIFLTDGVHSGATLPIPERDTIWVQAILSEALNVSNKKSFTPVTIYALTLGFPVPEELKKITRSTPFGDFFESNMNFDELYALMRSIMAKAGTIGAQPPCEVWWETDCKGGGVVEVSVPELGVSDTMSYKIPDSVKTYLSVSPPYFVQTYRMGKTTSVFDAKLTAKNYDLNVTGHLFNNNNFTITDWGGIPPPFLMKKGESRNLKITYYSYDSLFSEGVLKFYNNACFSDSLLFLMDVPPMKLTMEQEFVICQGESVRIGDLKSVTGGLKPYKYRWFPNYKMSNDSILNPLVTPDTTTLYELIVTDGKNDTVRGTVLVRVEELPKPEIEGKTQVCVFTNENYSIKNYDSTSVLQWMVSGGILNGSNSGKTINVSWSGGTGGLIELIETNKAGCIDSTSLIVKLVPIPSPKISGIDSGTVGFLSVYKCPAPPGTENLWTVVNGRILGANNLDTILVVWEQAGSGCVFVTQTELSTACANSDSTNIKITTPEELVVIAGEDKEICLNEATVIGLPNPAYGGVPPYAFKWTPSGGLDDDTKTTPTAKPTQTTEYILEVTDSLGTKKYDSLVVTVHPLPTPLISGKKTAYVTESIAYSVTNMAGHTYKWTVENGTLTGADNISQIQVDWNQIGTGKVKIIQTSDKGCLGADSIYVNVAPKKKVVISVPDTSVWIGVKDFCIPVSAENKENISGTYIFDALVSYNASLMLPVPDSTLEIKNGRRLIKFENQNINFTDGKFRIAAFCGNILLPDSDRTAVQIDSFRLYEPSIDVEIINGSVTIEGLCSRNLSRIKLFNPPELNITPNPASDYIVISATNNSTLKGIVAGMHIYNVFGEEVHPLPVIPLVAGASASSSQTSVRLDISILPAGMYFVREGDMFAKFLKL